jgi:hypothetical protein
MASMLDGILAPLGGIFKLLNSPLATIIIILGVVFVLAGIALWMQIKPVKKILYFSPEEHTGEEFIVEQTTPAFLHTKKKGGLRYRFIRYRDAYQFQLGMRSVTRWLATKGTAYAKKLESGELGEYTLYKVMESVWSKDVVENLQDDIKQKLIESEIMITVKVEEQQTPEGYKPLTELNIKKESDGEMAKLFGDNIRKEFHREDWIRTIALLGAGVAIAYVAQAMGIIAGVNY